MERRKHHHAYKVIAPDGRPENAIMVVPTEVIEPEAKMMIDFVIAMLKNRETFDYIAGSAEGIVDFAADLAAACTAEVNRRGWSVPTPLPWEAQLGEVGPKEDGDDSTGGNARSENAGEASGNS